MSERYFVTKMKSVLDAFLKETKPQAFKSTRDKEIEDLVNILGPCISWKMNETTPVRANLNVAVPGETDVITKFRDWFKGKYPVAYNNPGNIQSNFSSRGAVSLHNAPPPMSAEAVKSMIEAAVAAVTKSAVPAEAVQRDAVMTNAPMTPEMVQCMVANAVAAAQSSMVQVAAVPTVSAADIKKLVDTTVKTSMTQHADEVVGEARVQFAALSDRLAGSAVDSINDEKTTAKESSDLLKETRKLLEDTLAQNQALLSEKAKAQAEAESKAQELESVKQESSEALKLANETAIKVASASKDKGETDKLKTEFGKLSLLVKTLQEAKKGESSLVDNSHFIRDKPSHEAEERKHTKSKLAGASIDSAGVDGVQRGFLRSAFKSFTSTCKKIVVGEEKPKE